MTDVKMDKKRANQAAKIKKYIASGAVYFFLALMAFIVLFPFWIALVTSFKLPAESLSLDFTWWPETFTLNGYIDVFTYVGGNTVQTPLIILGFINTMWMYLPRAVIATVLAGMAGFAYAKLRFRAKNAMFGFLMATMMLPGVITLVPSYLLFYYYDWLNTPLPVIMPGLLGGVSAVFFLKQYYAGVPSDMMDAASVDGLGFFGIYFRCTGDLSGGICFRRTAGHCASCRHSCGRRTGKEQGRKCDCPAEHAAGQVDVTACREGFRPYGPRMQRAMQLRTEAPQRRRPIFFQAHGAPWQSQRRRACTAA